MALAPQQVYISQAQTVQGLWNQWLGLYAAIGRINQYTTKNGAQNVWKAFATAAQASNAALGTADGSPVITDPITTGNLGFTATDAINALNDLIALAAVFDGSGGQGIMTGAIDHRGDAPSVTSLTN
jgi:hypothetical protein